MFSIIFGLFEQVLWLISYISNGNSFPKPLTANEEEEYLDKYRNGDINARDVLIEHNLRLVAHIAKKYSSSIRDNEDLISIGTIGLMKAITTFNNGKGTRLATYAARCIENAILTMRKSEITLMGYLRQKRTQTTTFVSVMWYFYPL